ncbi:MAG: hypothetical protein KIS94_05320 [Chitinophagales bacterium]|nr:hypothetical protein [Chitinophagales bacterium]
MSNGTIRVKVYDNYHYMDEDEAYIQGSYDTYESALNAAKAIVESSLKESWKPGMSFDELLVKYKHFGLDPVILSDMQNGYPGFSAWHYAEERAKEICIG